MSEESSKPIIFLAFANDRDDNVGYLRNLPDEARRLRDTLKPAEQAGLCEVVVRSNSTAEDIFKVFQDPKNRNRVAIFHYGGHANGYELLLESADGSSSAADAGGLASFLGQQQGLQLVFLNGCSTQHQTDGLLDANVSVVISTSRAIDDQVATDFSNRFYQGLAGGATIRTAFNEAEAAVQTAKGGDTRSLYFGGSDESKAHLDSDRWPWELYLRDGSESADQWNFPEAVNDPLFGLPPLPQQDLPESPFRHLNWFTRKEAEVFFGRGHQIRELFDRLTAPRTAPILLFYGQSGVGKSSILDAGLIPRLEHDNDVRYLRRTEAGLLDTLGLAFLPEAAGEPLVSAWQSKEAQTGRPLIVFLDQVEELFTRPVAEIPNELDDFLTVVNAIFVESEQRPKGKLVLGFRKEWLAELESELVEYKLPRTKVFLEPLDRRGIIEVVRGPAESKRLRERYGLTIDGVLPEIIADDLLEDRDAAIAPTLQILLTKMWGKATEGNYENPCFNQELYQRLKRDGILLRDFLNQQIEAFRNRYPEAVDSGLLLDIVALHTTPLGTAEQCTVEELQEQYSHLDATLPELLQQCQDLHLLTVATGTQKEISKTTRLAHDTLAPLVRERFDTSDKPGQRARRVLDSRLPDWMTGRKGTQLDDVDLGTVEDGKRGTRSWTVDEARLVEASREIRRLHQRMRRIWQVVGIAAILLITVVGGFALIKSIQLTKTIGQRDTAEKERLVAEVDSLLHANPSAVSDILRSLEPVREKILPHLQELARQEQVDNRARTRLALALLRDDEKQLEFLETQLLGDDPNEIVMLCHELQEHRDDLQEPLWQLAEDSETDSQLRFRAACVLAQFAPDDPRWESIRTDVTQTLMVQPPLLLPTWLEALNPVRSQLKEPLLQLFRTRGNYDIRFLAASVLADSLTTGDEEFIRLVFDSDFKQFQLLLPVAKQHREQVIPQLIARLDKPLKPTWSDISLESRSAPSPDVVSQVQSTGGIVDDRFAMAQAIPRELLEPITEGLRIAGYRPLRCRPFFGKQKLHFAIVWVRDNFDWKLATDLSLRDAQQRIRDWEKLGYTPMDVSGYPGNEGDRYIVLCAATGQQGTKTILGKTVREISIQEQKLCRNNLFYPVTAQTFVSESGTSRHSSVYHRSGMAPVWFDHRQATEPFLSTRLTPSRFQSDICLFHPQDAPQMTSSLVTASEATLKNSAINSRGLIANVAKSLTDGSQLMVDKKYDEAIEKFTRGITAFPLHPGGYGLRAVSYARLGRKDEALKDLAEMRRVTTETLTLVGNSRLKRNARQSLGYVEAIVSASTGNPSFALDSMNELLELETNDPQSLFFAARAAATIAEICQQTDRKDAADRACKISVEYLRKSIEFGFRNSNWELESDWELEILRDRQDFQDLGRKFAYQRRYAGVWNGLNGWESKTLLGLTAERHVVECRMLAEAGFRPASISVDSEIDNESLVAASTWMRPLIGPQSKTKDAYEKVNAAICLLLLGQEDIAWAKLRASDPTFRTQAIHQFQHNGVTHEVLMNRLDEESDVAMRRFLILALGEYDWNQFSPDEQNELGKKLASFYRSDPDSGVHSAVRFTLTRWNQIERLNPTGLVSQDPVEGRRWYRNSKGHTFATIKGPVEFEMGSPANETSRDSSYDPSDPGSGIESIHLKRIPRSFAIATTETTVTQFLRFQKDFTFSESISPTSDSPIVGVDWYDAIKYCRWLSEQEGIPEDQMCYPKITKIDSNMELPRNFLDRTGYRLPTEAEWEFACRAGSKTTYSFGENTAFFMRYAWCGLNSNRQAHPVAQLKPNELGLFDVHGNVNEWCFDVLQAYRILPGGRATPDQLSHRETGMRIVRGGACLANAAILRSARRIVFQENTKNMYLGFRIARTLPR